ncbi:MAG: hypothetical protein G01um101438_1049 [Parcubacteria group bacterium Gr01-1014_38]|nr:MAG: hypothetical protein G01um101438_1049 [Parcubacteria group bacterium Gr01-1014_38]
MPIRSMALRRAENVSGSPNLSGPSGEVGLRRFSPSSQHAADPVGRRLPCAHPALMDLLEVPCEANENLRSLQLAERRINRRNLPLSPLPTGINDVQEQFEKRLFQALSERVLFGLCERPPRHVHILQEVVHCLKDGSIGDERHL